MLSYALRDLVRNPRRALASVAGVALAVGLLSGIVFFVDSSAASMTQRAIAPVKIDMQVGLTSALASPLALQETVAATSGGIAAGQVATVTLSLANTGDAPLTGVLLKDRAPSPLVYVAGSTRLNGTAIADIDGQSPFESGLQAGSLAPHASLTASYQARATSAVASVHALAFRGSAASQQDAVPAAAGAAPPLSWNELQARVAKTPEVATADRLASLDLPAGALSAGSQRLSQPLRVFAFDTNYLARYPMIRLSAGEYSPGSVLLSPAAAQAIGVNPGSSVALTVPGRAQPLSVKVGGVADFSGADALFTSRAADTQGEFVQVPNVLVVSPDEFGSQVLPALRADAGSLSPVLKSAPFVEVDVRMRRDRLATDPIVAVVATQSLKRTLERQAPGQVAVIDNLSEALNAAKSDVILAKVLFIFLGLPGVLLAAYLCRYAGGLLAQAQRRELATLRARGAQPMHLIRVLTYHTVMVALLGSGVGLALGFGGLYLLFGRAALTGAAPQSLLLSVALSIAAGIATTAVALYLPGRRSLSRAASEERREMEVAPAAPAWLRLRLDLVFGVAAALVVVVTLLAGGFKPTSAEGQSVSLSFYTLLAPLLAWIGATLLAVRGVLAVAGRVPGRNREGFGRLFGGTLGRSLRRRSGALSGGVIAISLAVAFGASLSIFTASYEAEKQAGAQLVVGSDLRVTPSALSRQPAGFSGQLRVAGVAGVTPVAQTSSALVGADKRTLVAVDPASLPQVAYLPDSFFTGIKAPAAISALRSDPAAVLISDEMAKTFNIQPGDQVKVQLTDSAGSQIAVTLHAAGLFHNFPGFPQGVDLVGNLAFYQSATGLDRVDLFLVKAFSSDPGSLARIASAIRTGPGVAVPLQLQTISTAINQDQSSLVSLNLRGLGSMESAYAVLMGAVGIAIFVFGLLLERRREYVTMRALGIRIGQLRMMILGEASLVAALSLVIGALVGAGMAVMFVRILSPLFTLTAGALTLPAGRLALLGIVLVVGTGLSALVATRSLHRLNPMEMLREE